MPSHTDSPDRADSVFTNSKIDARWVSSGLRMRVLLPLALGLLLLVGAIGALTIMARMDANREAAARTGASVATMIAGQTEQEVQTMRSVMDFLLADPALRDALRARDRAALLRLAAPTHRAILERNQISHFYFHLPDRTNLLRVHAPDHDGDRIDRFTLKEAQRTGRPFWANEQGPLGSFTLRVVYPWHADGTLIGFLELGVEFEHIAQDIKQSIGADVYVAIDKGRFDAKRWEATQKTSKQPIAWNEFPRAIVLTRTTGAIPRPVADYLRNTQPGSARSNFEGVDDGRHLQVFVRPFELGGERLGELLVAQDISFAVQERRRDVSVILGLSLAVGGILMLLLHAFLGRVERDIHERTQRLEEARNVILLEQHDRQQAQQALAAQQERNELLEARGRMVEELAAAGTRAEAALRENEEITEALRDTQGQLVATAREAGRAEIATNVLHNVGNVLNSVNISAGVISSTLQKSRLPGLPRGLALLQEHGDDLGRYLTEDPKGKLLPGSLEAVAQAVAAEHKGMAEELTRLIKSIDHIKDIVSTQQTHAAGQQVIEPVQPGELAEDALRMQGSALARHQVAVVKEFEAIPPVPLDRGRVLQILVNLISNAKAAMSTAATSGQQLTLRIDRPAPDRLRFVVKDEGEGISPENLTRIFSHGFTTRRTGHGFGLHSSALAARELGGSLTVLSEGVGKGATFTLELPLSV
ncbi:MAG TPA: ATP-binding protein [Ramlibacter sp.]